MKKFILVTLVAIVGMALIGCQTTANTNANLKANMTTVNSNTAVVLNSNSMNTNMGMNTNMNNRALTREEYDRDKDRYSQEAKTSGRTVGSGVEDGWLWTKTRAELLATNDLRESTINVDVSNNVVTLTGSVASNEQKEKAASVAKGVSGVTSVRNMLKVNANDSMTNQMTGANSTVNTNKKY
jgi:hyperosmotically inducible protein